MIPYVLCSNIFCIKTNDCYRFRALSDDENQRYFNFINICNQENNHKMIMKIKENDNVVELPKLIGIPEKIIQNTDISDLNDACESQSIGI